ncbi:hypothetical protein FNE85_17465 [Escherichia coli]|nr:hypothetical protein FNE85_17465 [Escherichia coli]
MNVSKYVAIFSFVFIQLISVGKVFANADEWMTTFRENIAQTWQQPEHYDLGNDSNLLIVFYVQIMPDDFVMQLHRF